MRVGTIARIELLAEKSGWQGPVRRLVQRTRYRYSRLVVGEHGQKAGRDPLDHDRFATKGKMYLNGNPDELTIEDAK